MGKGGEPAIATPVLKTVNAPQIDKSRELRIASLSKLNVSELRKWAKSYGLPDDLDENSLLTSLVSAHELSLFLFLN